MGKHKRGRQSVSPTEERLDGRQHFIRRKEKGQGWQMCSVRQKGFEERDHILLQHPCGYTIPAS
jgi:hypothetical protein